MDLKEKLLAEEKKLKELTLAREERRRKRQQAREQHLTFGSQEDTNSPLNEEFKDETSTSGINVDSNGRKQKDEDLITEKIQATTNEPEAESRKWSNDDIKEKEAEVLTISDIDDLERTLRNLEAVCNDTNLSYEERSAVRRRIRKLKSEAITYQDVCSENKKDASGKENYKNKKEMFKTSMASNEGGNYPRPGFTRKTVESIKDKQEEERAAEFVNNQDVCKKNKKDATEDKYFEKKASKTLMGSHKGGSYPLQESSRKSVEPKQDKQKEERIAEFVETKKQAPEVKANDASDNLLNKGLPQNHEILLKELESVRDDPKATYNERSEARRKIRELKRDGYLMPDKGVKVDQKIPTKEIEKQSTKMQSQLKLNEEVGSRKSNESINEKYSGSKPSKQSKTNAGAAITKTPEKKEGKSKTLESPTLQVSKNVFKPAEGNLLKATVALLNKAFHKNIQCSERDLLTAIKDGVLLNQFLNYCVPDAIDERVINRNAGNNAEKIKENFTLLIQSCYGIGCNITVTENDLLRAETIEPFLCLIQRILKEGVLRGAKLTEKKSPPLDACQNCNRSLDKPYYILQHLTICKNCIENEYIQFLYYGINISDIMEKKSDNRPIKPTPKKEFSVKDNIFKQKDKGSPSSKKSYGSESPKVPGKLDNLLRWAQLRTVGFNVPIENLTTSWNDGLAFCALLSSLGLEDEIHFHTLSKNDKRHNLQLAFTVAEKNGVAPMLDVDDMCSTVIPSFLG